MSELNEKKEMTKEEFAANEIKAFCEHVMHPDSDLHKDAEWWIKERLQANGTTTGEKQCNLPVVVCSCCGKNAPEICGSCVSDIAQETGDAAYNSR